MINENALKLLREEMKLNSPGFRLAGNLTVDLIDELDQRLTALEAAKEPQEMHVGDPGDLRARAKIRKK
jgi:hypothetical protein